MPTSSDDCITDFLDVVFSPHHYRLLLRLQFNFDLPFGCSLATFNDFRAAIYSRLHALWQRFGKRLVDENRQDVGMEMLFSMSVRMASHLLKSATIPAPAQFTRNLRKICQYITMAIASMPDQAQQPNDSVARMTFNAACSAFVINEALQDPDFNPTTRHQIMEQLSQDFDPIVLHHAADSSPNDFVHLGRLAIMHNKIQSLLHSCESCEDCCSKLGLVWSDL